MKNPIVEFVIINAILNVVSNAAMNMRGDTINEKNIYMIFVSVYAIV